MKSKLTNFFVFAFLAMKSFSQEKSTTLSGVIYNSYSTVSDVHIINLSNKYGSVSNKNGEFKIKVTLNDVLLFSSIQHKIIKIKINQNIINSGFLKVELTPSVTILDEVFLHGLSGNLEIDLQKTPKDSIPKHNFKFNPSDVYKIKEDYATNFLKPPNAEALTNPILMNGAGAAATIPDFQYIAEQRLKKSLAKKKSFPAKIIREFGIDFFVKDLKIPENKIHHFISYCEYRNIVEKYYNKKVLEVIEILTEESKTYTKIEH